MENYHIYNEIGRGTHSFVYKARRKRSIEYVAVKSTAKSRMDKILNEVPFLHKLDSPYVLKFLDWYESSNHIWLILEYCVGGDLLHLITQDKEMPEAVVKSFGFELVAGLQYLHANSILYCDLKPASVLIDERGSLKLADFGLARRIPGIDTAPIQPLAPGSPHYMAPELFHQTTVHSFASDFWALGCVLYELRTGRQPFVHTNFSELARMIQTEAVQLPVPEYEMSLEFCDLLRRLLVKDPYQRITWDELAVHPFWDGLPRLENVVMPPQTIFDRRSPMSQNDDFTCNRDEDCENARNREVNSTDRDKAYNEGIPKIVNCENARNRDENYTDRDKAYNEDIAKNVNSHEKKQQSNKSGAVADDGEVGYSSPRSSDSCKSMRDHVAPSAGKNDNQLIRAPIAQTRDPPNNNGDVEDGDDVQGEFDQLTGRRQRLQTCKLPQVASATTQHLRGQRIQGQQIQLSGLYDGSGVSRRWLSKISELVFTAADCRVKPIVRNEDTELDEFPRVHAALNRCALISPEVLLSCAVETFETQLREVFVNLNSYDSNTFVKLSYLAYLISLSSHTRLADVIVSSPILELLIRMLVQEVQLATSGETILSMLCLDLAVLFRSTTAIALSSPTQLRHLRKSLLTIVAGPPFRSKDEKSTSRKESQSRSRALACLGELLLYMLIKKKCKLPVDAVDAVLIGIEDMDLATRCYAVRTLCSILTHSTESLLPKLISGKVVLALIRGLLRWRTPEYDDQKDTDDWRLLDALRTTTTETLAQVLRHLRTPSSSARLPSRLKRLIMLYFAKPDVLNAVWQGVENPRGSSDLVLASLNVINAILDTELNRDREAEYAAIQSSRVLLLGRIVAISTIQTIMTMDGLTADGNENDECLATLRAKSLIMLHLGLQLNRDFLISFVQNDALTLVEQTLGTIAELLNADHSNLVSQSLEIKLSAVELYLTQCAFNLCKLVIEISLELGVDCFTSFRACGHANERNNAKNEWRVSPTLFQLFSGLLERPNCRQQLLNYLTTDDTTQYTFFLRRMAKLLISFPNEVISTSRESGTKSTIACSVSEMLLLLFQSAASEADDIVLVDEHELFTNLLPAVVKVVYGDMESNDEQAAVNCLRLLHVVLLDFDYGHEKDEYELYDPFVRSILLPYLSNTLRRRGAMVERIWSLSSELLFGLLSSDSSLVSEAEDLDLVSTVVNLLCVPATFTSLPANATQLVQILMDSADVGLDWLLESGIARSMVIGLTLTAKRKQVDESLVDLVAILLTLLQHEFEKTRRPGVTPAPPGFNDLVACGPLLLQFCACDDETQLNGQPESLSLEHKTNVHDVTLEVADIAARCLVLLSRIFGEQLNAATFAPSKAFSCLSDEREPFMSADGHD